jgi:hypothetical protein
MSEATTFDVWGFRTPPSWALRALEKGIIDANRFEALIRVAAEEGDGGGHRPRSRRNAACSCRRRSRRSCTRWRA